jgi:hypothetical protein
MAGREVYEVELGGREGWRLRGEVDIWEIAWRWW